MTLYQTLFVVVLGSILLAVSHAGTIQLKVVFSEGGVSEPLEGASVKCFDEDFIFRDQTMTDTVTTDAQGIATLSYKNKRGNTFFKPCRAWDCGTSSSGRPDIYCIISKSDGYFTTKYTPTLENHNQNNVANFGIIRVYPDRQARGDPGTINGCGPASIWGGLRDYADFISGFGDVCNNHDLCYNSCLESRNSCDVEFLDLMISTCHNNHDQVLLQKNCKNVAYGMIAIVLEFGEDSFVEGQSLFGCIGSPTDTPSKSPTGQPTQAPSTDTPTLTPSEAPSTAAPTGQPTENPTTFVPTMAPTDDPTTENPTTFAPTMAPTDDPTMENPATFSPTMAPTDDPTPSPSEPPTDTPSLTPTKSPSDEPTETPTELPTRPPTGQPTKVPTEGPSELPTTTENPTAF